MLQIPRWQVVGILIILLLGLAYAAPNVLPRSDEASDLPGWVPHKQINLGLDLQGGSYLLMEVQLDEVIREIRETWVDSLRGRLRAEKILYKDLGIANQRAGFELLDPTQEDAARDMLRQDFVNLDIQVEDGIRFSIGFTEQMETERKTNIMNQMLEIIRLRLDELGTREPTIQRHGDNRILVQVPGVDNPEEVKKTIGTTARMDFRFVEEGVNPEGRIPAGAEVLDSDELGPTGQPIRYVVSKRRIHRRY